MLDQRETGLKDIGLNGVSESTSAFIHLHDLRGPVSFQTAPKKVRQGAQNIWLVV